MKRKGCGFDSATPPKKRQKKGNVSLLISTMSDILPEEIIFVHILSQKLDAALCVCKKWREGVAKFSLPIFDQLLQTCKDVFLLRSLIRFNFGLLAFLQDQIIEDIPKDIILNRCSALAWRGLAAFKGELTSILPPDELLRIKPLVGFFGHACYSSARAFNVTVQCKDKLKDVAAENLNECILLSFQSYPHLWKSSDFICEVQSCLRLIASANDYEMVASLFDVVGQYLYIRDIAESAPFFSFELCKIMLDPEKPSIRKLALAKVSHFAWRIDWFLCVTKDEEFALQLVQSNHWSILYHVALRDCDETSRYTVSLRVYCAFLESMYIRVGNLSVQNCLEMCLFYFESLRKGVDQFNLEDTLDEILSNETNIKQGVYLAALFCSINLSTLVFCNILSRTDLEFQQLFDLVRYAIYCDKRECLAALWRMEKYRSLLLDVKDDLYICCLEACAVASIEFLNSMSGELKKAECENILYTYAASKSQSAFRNVPSECKAVFYQRDAGYKKASMVVMMSNSHFRKYVSKEVLDVKNFISEFPCSHHLDVILEAIGQNLDTKWYVSALKRAILHYNRESLVGCLLVHSKIDDIDRLRSIYRIMAKKTRSRKDYYLIIHTKTLPAELCQELLVETVTHGNNTLFRILMANTPDDGLVGTIAKILLNLSASTTLSNNTDKCLKEIVRHLKSRGIKMDKHQLLQHIKHLPNAKEFVDKMC